MPPAATADAATCSWSSAPCCSRSTPASSRVIQNAGVESTTLTTVRCTGTALVLVAVVLARGERLRLPRGRRRSPGSLASASPGWRSSSGSTSSPSTGCRSGIALLLRVHRTGAGGAVRPLRLPRAGPPPDLARHRALAGRAGAGGRGVVRPVARRPRCAGRARGRGVTCDVLPDRRAQREHGRRRCTSSRRRSSSLRSSGTSLSPADPNPRYRPDEPDQPGRHAEQSGGPVVAAVQLDGAAGYGRYRSWPSSPRCSTSARPR